MKKMKDRGYFSNDLYFKEQSLNIFIEQLQATEKATFAIDGANITFRCFVKWDNDIFYQIYYETLETDREYKERLAQETLSEKRQKKEYLRLKAKFEPEIK